MTEEEKKTSISLLILKGFLWLFFNPASLTAIIVALGVLFAQFGYFDNILPASTIQFETPSDQPIASLSEGSGIHGSFFLGSGSVSDKTYYYFYAGNVSYRLMKVPTDNSEIFMDDNENPHITRVLLQEKTCMKNGRCTITVPFSNSGRYEYTTRGPIRYEFHVPNGTIVRQYSLGGSAP